MNIYYVYAYLRSKDSITAKAGTPYYIGKGKNFRAFKNHKHIPIPKDKKLIVIVEQNLTEIGALALERRLIKWYGRKNTGSGILLNRTNGGDGVCGMVGVTRNLATRQKMSAARFGKRHTDETKKKIGEKSNLKIFTKEYREKLSVSGVGPDSIEVRKRKSDAAKARWAKVSLDKRKEHMLSAHRGRTNNHS